MSDRFEQQSQSLVDYAEPPAEPLLARSLDKSIEPVSLKKLAPRAKIKTFAAQSVVPGQRA
jgi:hypothetical protein